MKFSVSFLSGFSLIDSKKGANCVCDRATVVSYQETGSCSPLIVYGSINSSIVNSCLSICVPVVTVYLSLSFRLIYLFLFKRKRRYRKQLQGGSETTAVQVCCKLIHSNILVKFTCDPGSGIWSGQTLFILNDADTAFLNRFFQLKL